MSYMTQRLLLCYQLPQYDRYHFPVTGILLIFNVFVVAANLLFLQMLFSMHATIRFTQKFNLNYTCNKLCALSTILYNLIFIILF